jgi:hypothetical protein|tara:strand:- start:2812 stop:3489 length:678 start_codon:yes stop_codon:yes gene_type:complete
MIEWSKKAINRLHEPEAHTFLSAWMDSKLKGSKLIYWNLRSLRVFDVRQVFDQTRADDDELIAYYSNFIFGIPLWEDDEMVLKLADAVNKRISYKYDSVNWGKIEYWASPIEVHRRKYDDCDGYAVLLVYLMGLFGIGPYRRYVRAGWALHPDGRKEGHAHAVYFSYKYNTFFALEGSFYPSKVNKMMNKTPLYENEYYGDHWFLTNEEKSYGRNWLLNFTGDIQ